jgi:RNA polymerase sigma factor (sigma-70 family)
MTTQNAETGETYLEELVTSAQDGQAAALEQIVVHIQGKIYNIALRMLWCPDDARDATQEVLIRVITHLGGFRGESAFMTWVYRVATNYLNTMRKGNLEDKYTFERFGGELDEYLSDDVPETENPAQMSLLLEEIKIGCTTGMLLCLDRPHRMAYILGEILEINSQEAADILDIPPATFRKRLSRARAEIVTFMRRKCGLINPDSPCHCRRRVNFAITSKRVNPERFLFAHDAERAKNFPEVLNKIRALEYSQRVIALYRSHPESEVPSDFTAMIKNLIQAQQLHR